MPAANLSALATSSYLPHGICLTWKPALVALHVLSDGVIALSYFSIPFALAFFVGQRRDLEYRWMFILFAAFILACGTTHIFDIWTLWRPNYVAQGWMKAITAAISLATAILLWPVMRQAVGLPTPSQLRLINESLTREVAMRRETVRQLEAEARERHQLEIRLRQNEARLKTLLDTAVEGILTIDDRGRVEVANKSAARLFGFKPGELEGRDTHALLLAEGRPLTTSRLLRLALTGGGQNLEGTDALLGIRRDGSLFPVDLSVGRYQDAAPHFTCVLRDMTERRKTEQLMHEKEELLKQQEGELLHIQRLTTAGELAAMMAHEINQPLAAITNYLGGIQLRFSAVLEANGALKDAIGESLRLAQRASDIVQTLRNLARPRTDGRKTINLLALVSETLSLLAPELERRQIELVTWFPRELPPVIGQRIQLQQLLLNLILNAAEAMVETPPGQRRLVIALRMLADGRIEISLNDTGHGLTPDQAQRIFQPFVTSKTDGIGLGLSICKSIVEAHGGEIEARPEDGQGATFTVRLPVRPAEFAA
jgi:two-component system sensor kinase FixL